MIKIKGIKDLKFLFRIKDQIIWFFSISLSTFKLRSQENQGSGHAFFSIMYFSKFSQFENFFYSF